MRGNPSSNPIDFWHPLPHWFRSAAATRDKAVLLETGKLDAENFCSFLFTEPAEELTAWSGDQVNGVFAAIDRHLRHGSFVAGFVSYECGAVLHEIHSMEAENAQELPLIRMGVFPAPTIFDHRTGVITGSQRPGFSVGEVQTGEVRHAQLQIGLLNYEQRIRIIQNYLAAGHSYQVNFTDRVSGEFSGTPLALYEQVLSQQPVSYAAFLSVEGRQILSFSPELFYRTQEGRIRVRPMKGTWPRGRNNAEDEDAARSLRSDEKNRAEHITIVDLLRNDLGRVCKLGSVALDALMRVERYSTLHQMTSDISGTLQPQRSASEIFQALFPSGSITGAPKRRTMKIIRETERRERGVYTGSIGYFGPQGQACFNVAIRTLLVENNSFTLGVGGGITVDSIASAEYAECKLKASFLTRREPEFYLFETMRGVRGAVPRLGAHLRRMKNSAEYFGIRYDEVSVHNDVVARVSTADAEELRVRLLLQRSGKWSIEINPLESVPWSGKVLLWPEPVQTSNVYLQHKTSNREFYRGALLKAQQQGFDEVLFTNEEGFVTEGAVNNVFASIRGRTVTPHLKAGLLPGVERAHLLAMRPETIVCELTLPELLAATDVWLCNALRGSREVRLICNSLDQVLWSSTKK